VEYKYINIVLKRGNGLVDGIQVKGYQQGTDIVIYENEHASESDVIGTFLHELAHFLTPAYMKIMDISF
jgi:Zn-dependent peptidase ImmA (M78 family)